MTDKATQLKDMLSGFVLGVVVTLLLIIYLIPSRYKALPATCTSGENAVVEYVCVPDNHWMPSNLGK